MTRIQSATTGPTPACESSYKDIARSLLSHVKNIFPWHVSRIGSMRLFPSVFAATDVASSVLSGISSLLLSYSLNETILPRTFSDARHLVSTHSTLLLKKTISLVLFLDFFGLAPELKVYRVAADGFLLLASFFGCLKVLKDGSSQILFVASSNTMPTKEKVKKLVCGGLLISMGGWTLSRLYSHSINLYEGTKLFDSLSDKQKEGVFKYRAIHHLPNEKKINGVVIDGMSSKWGRRVDDIPSSFGELMYEKAHTRFYRADSSQSFCQALEDASKYFGGKVENLAIMGHGVDPAGENSNQMIKMSSDYFFNGTEAETDCIREYLKENSHLFLISCNSATKTTLPSLTERISNSISSISVTGIASFFNPMLSSVWSGPNDSLHLQSHMSEDLNGNAVLPFNAVVYPPTN